MIRKSKYQLEKLAFIAMLSSILKSERVVQMNMSIMRAFVKLRNAVAHSRSIAVRIE